MMMEFQLISFSRFSFGSQPMCFNDIQFPQNIQYNDMRNENKVGAHVQELKLIKMFVTFSRDGIQ